MYFYLLDEPNELSGIETKINFHLLTPFDAPPSLELSVACHLTGARIYFWKIAHKYFGPTEKVTVATDDKSSTSM